MNKNLEHLLLFIQTGKEAFERNQLRTPAKISWDDDKWLLGKHSSGWLSGTGRNTLTFNKVGNINKRVNTLLIENTDFKNMMKTISCIRYSSASSMTVDNLLLRQLYFSLVEKTGQSNPIYINNEVAVHTMLIIVSAKNSSNISNYGYILQSICELIDRQNFTLTPISFKSKYGGLCSSYTVRLAKAQKIKNGEDVDDIARDDKLLTIKGFMNIISLFHDEDLTKSHRIGLCMSILQIATGLRFEEVSGIKLNALTRKPLTGEQLAIAKQKNISTYDLKLSYLGVKNSTAKAHWVEPMAIPLVETVVKVVTDLTSPYREILTYQRSNNFTDMLPKAVTEDTGYLIELDDVFIHIFHSLSKASKSRRIKDNARKAMAKICKVHSSTLHGDYYKKSDINENLIDTYKKCNVSDGVVAQFITIHCKQIYKTNYEDLLFIIPTDGLSCGSGRVCHSLITYITHSDFSKFMDGENKAGRSGITIFIKYGLLEDNGEPTRVKSHMGRHNVNTFFALAGITEHLQAILMGRRDIKQNEHYQHVSLSVKLANQPMLGDESFLDDVDGLYDIAINKEDETLIETEKKELSDLFDDEVDTEPYLPVVQDIDESDKYLYASIDQELEALFSAESSPINPIDNMKKNGGMLPINPNVDIEHGIKQALHTHSDRVNNARFIEKAMEIGYYPELSREYKDLIKNDKKDDAKNLLEAHASINILPMGTCTRETAVTGCPLGIRCQSGGACGYFTLTGRLGELDVVSNRLASAKKELLVLEEIANNSDGYSDGLKIMKENVDGLERIKEKAALALSQQIFVPLFQTPTPEQLYLSPKPKKLADMFLLDLPRLTQSKENNDDS